MKRRDFIGLGVVAAAGVKVWAAGPAGKAKITDKDILKEGKPAAISNYCEEPDKNAKACPMYKDKPGHCKTCMFYNKDASETDFKGKKYARCQLLADPKQPQFVSEIAYCATYVKQS